MSTRENIRLIARAPLREILLDYRKYHDFDEWPTSGENLSLGFLTRQDSNLT